MFIDTPEVREIVKRAFPDYNGRKFSVHPFTGPMRLTSYWSGGSRDFWAAVNMVSGVQAHVPENGSGFTADVGKLKELPPGVALVRRTMGGYESAAVYVHPDNLTKMLPAPAEVTADEKIVLCATASYKSSCAGIKNYRLHEAQQYTGITEDRWNVAKSALIVRGLLNKAGAITDGGRNIVADTRLYNLKPATV